MNVTLKSCPFCESKELRVTDTIYHNRKGNSVTMYHVMCLSCGTSGPVDFTEEDAVRVWNRRTDSEKEFAGKSKKAILGKAVEHKNKHLNTPAYCWNCGRSVSLYANYCQYCGERIQNE